MATVELAGSNTKGVAEYSPKLQVIERVVDVGANTPGASDTVECVNIPAGFFILAGLLKILTAGTATANAQLGMSGTDITDDPNGLITVQNMDDAAGTVFPFDGAYILTNGGIYIPTANTVDLLFDTAADILGVYLIKIIGFMERLTSA